MPDASLEPYICVASGPECLTKLWPGGGCGGPAPPHIPSSLSRPSYAGQPHGQPPIPPSDFIPVAENTGLPGQALVIEITESGLMETSTASQAMAQLDRLRTRKVRIAIGDFGIGYSSLAYVARLDIVKSDNSFLQGPAQAGEGMIVRAPFFMRSCTWR